MNKTKKSNRFLAFQYYLKAIPGKKNDNMA